MHGLSRRDLESPLKQTGAGLSHDLPLLEVSNVSKRFEGDEGAIEALTTVSMTAWPGEFVSIVGPSGGGHVGMDERIGVDDEIGAGDDVAATHGDQVRRPRPGADEMHRHPGVPSK